MLYIVITDFNGIDQTRRCLEALKTSQCRDFSVLVVDHGTDGRTREALARDYPQVLRVEGTPDLWWTGATNLGIRAALDHGASLLMLLNNDCYVSPNTVGTMLKVGRAYPDSIIAPVQRDWRTGKITAISPSSCFLLGFPTVPGPRRSGWEKLGREVMPVKLIVGGRGVILQPHLLSVVGLFDDDNLPHYGADHDFYLRARRCGVPLIVALGTSVNIDNTKTTSAEQPGRLKWAAFVRTLTDRRSHRNLRDISTLFRKHYPIPKLHIVGVGLYMARYVLVYIVKRTSYLLFERR